MVIRERSCKKGIDELVRSGLNLTYPSRLPLPSQKLQFLLVTELYENVNGPFVIISYGLILPPHPIPVHLVRRETIVQTTRLMAEGSGKFLSNTFHEPFGGGLPIILFSQSRPSLGNDTMFYVLWQMISRSSR